MKPAEKKDGADVSDFTTEWGRLIGEPYVVIAAFVLGVIVGVVADEIFRIVLFTTK